MDIPGQVMHRLSMFTLVRIFPSRISLTLELSPLGRASQEDFKRLLALNVTLEGKIALAKYGGPFRGLKVKNAQAAGMIGAVIFTDPGDDRNMTAKNYATYPDGPARNPTSIQKGSVMDLSTYPGDPTTPGYPSKETVAGGTKWSRSWCEDCSSD
jgi:hypothetical protein